MERFNWKASFNIGIDEMDQEHRGLLDRMFNLEKLNHSFVQKSKIVQEFSSFIEFTKEHFQHEESVMMSYNYAQLSEHMSIHRDLIDKLKKYKQELESSVYATLPSSVIDFFNNWLLTHILIIDRRYADFIISQNKQPMEQE